MSGMMRVVCILALSMISTAAQAQQNPLASTLLFPQIADGDGYAAIIQIENITPVAGQVTITAYRSDGTIAMIETDRGSLPLTVPITKLDSLRVRTLNVGGLVSGWLQIDASVRVWGQVVQQYPFGEEVMSSAIRRNGFAAQARLETDPGIRTGLAIANVSQSEVRLTATLQDSLNRDSEGNPEILASTEVTIEPGRHIARFLDEEPFFPEFLAGRESFDGTIEVRASPVTPGSDDAMGALVIATTVRFIPLEGSYNFSASPVRPLPYDDQAQIADTRMNLVYFIESDRMIPPEVEYVGNFPTLIDLAGRLISIESERAGFGSRVLEFDPQVKILVGQKTASEYPSGGFERVAEIIEEVREAFGNTRNAVTAEGLLAFGGGGLLTFPSSSLGQVGELEAAIETAGEVPLLDVFVPASRVFSVAHEIGHAYGGLVHTDTLEAHPQIGRDFYDLMSISVASRKVGTLRTLFPGIDWITIGLSDEDLRHPTFTTQDLLILLAGGCGLPGNCLLREGP